MNDLLESKKNMKQKAGSEGRAEEWFSLFLVMEVEIYNFVVVVVPLGIKGLR